MLLSVAYGLELFADAEDVSTSCSILTHLSETELSCRCYAVSLHKTHAHLVIKEEQNKTGEAVKRIINRYVYYYNVKHNRYGAVFADRYKSQPVEDITFYESICTYMREHKAILSQHLSPGAILTLGGVRIISA